MKKIYAALLVMILCLAFTAQTALACTIFCATDGETVLIGNNEDTDDKDSYVWFLPSSKGAYGYVCFGSEEAQPQGGMNEAGFFFDLIANSAPQHAPNPEGKPDYPQNKGDMLLAQCGSVDDAIALITRHSPAEYGYITMMLADKSGVSATVTWDWASGQMVIEKNTGSYSVIGYGKNTVRPMLEEEAVTVDNFRSMLDAAHQGDYTTYSNIYNPGTGEVYIYNQHNYKEAVHYNLSDELEKGRHIFYIPALFPNQEPGIYNSRTVNALFSPGALELMAIFAGIYIFALYFWAQQIIVRRKTLNAAAWYYAAGILGSLCSAAILLFTLLHNAYILRYGFSLFGFAASILPWAFSALTAAQTVFSILLWIRKDIRLFGKILYTVVTLVSVFVFFTMALPGIQ